MEEKDKLCQLFNSMQLIQSVTYENYYEIIDNCFSHRLTIILSPEKNYYYEKLLKVVFNNVKNANIADMLFFIYSPSIVINDISKSGWENIHYELIELEGHFSFKFKDFCYEWISPIEIH
ncbi:MAG: hypothetical protein IJF18_04060 [Oscillospiraceae bacterium]|nr:hypothetical protein [Oscillospiraceae bacterium]